MSASQSQAAKDRWKAKSRAERAVITAPAVAASAARRRKAEALLRAAEAVLAADGDSPTSERG